MLHAESPWPAGTTQGQLDKLAVRAGLRFVADHPGLTIKRDAIKLFNFWQLERELIAGAAAGFFGQMSKPALLALAAVISLSYVAAMFSGIFGDLLVPPASWRAHWFLLLLIAYVCGMHALTFGHSRYHLPLMPLVLLYSGAAMARAADIWRQRRSPRFILAGADLPVWPRVGFLRSRWSIRSESKTLLQSAELSFLCMSVPPAICLFFNRPI